LRILLDSNALIWWLTGETRLTPEAAGVISSSSNEVFVSAASIWELSIKARLGKLQMPYDISQQMIRHRFLPLPISQEHALRVREMPLIHKDPFDRLLIAQALTEGLAVVTSDEVFERYGVQVVRT
jgi:PIN domain nuclease of toxin-antitoxin system